jgi:Fe2+ or Zn2+ uptake regulation protein
VTLDVHEAASVLVRDAGQRYTRQRRRLVELLADAARPLSIPQILRGGRELKQSSVYRNLSDLEQAGVVRRVVSDDEYGRYELAEELTGHHHHLICSSCGRMSDVGLPEGIESELDRALDRLAKRAGFASVVHRLDLVGLCGDCAVRSGKGQGVR